MIIRTNKGNRRFKDPQGLFVTPYDEDGLLGNDTYDIREIVGDTISITSDDATRTDIPDEFSDGNLYSNVRLGQQNFAADCIDFQNNIMKVLFGCEVKEDGSVLFPSEYKDINVMIRVAFEDCDLVIPMVALDSKANLENLRTDVARGQIVGVAKVQEVILGNAPTSGQGSASGPIEKTPMLYVPKNRAVFVESANNTYKTDYRGSSTGDIVTVTLTAPSNGTVEGLNSDANTVDKGAFITLNAVPDEGYVFSKFTIDGADVSRNPVGFAADKDMTVSVTFTSAI